MPNYSLETRINVLENMVLSLQGIVAYVFSEVAKTDPELAVAIRAGFDNAALSAEVLAMKKEGSKDEKGAGLDALRIIDKFRDITFPDKK